MEQQESSPPPPPYSVSLVQDKPNRGSGASSGLVPTHIRQRLARIIRTILDSDILQRKISSHPTSVQSCKKKKKKKKKTGGEKIQTHFSKNPISQLNNLSDSPPSTTLLAIALAQQILDQLAHSLRGADVEHLAQEIAVGALPHLDVLDDVQTSVVARVNVLHTGSLAGRRPLPSFAFRCSGCDGGGGKGRRWLEEEHSWGWEGEHVWGGD